LSSSVESRILKNVQRVKLYMQSPYSNLFKLLHPYSNLFKYALLTYIVPFSGKLSLNNRLLLQGLWHNCLKFEEIEVKVSYSVTFVGGGYEGLVT